MSDSLLFSLTLASALGCGLIAGVFFAFSVFVMRALARIPPLHGIGAMQSINVVVINPLFLGVFLGTAVVCAGLAVHAVANSSAQGSGYRLAGSMLYLVGTVVVTGIFNVPRNNALATVDPASEVAASVWARYLRSWTAWNHVRTAASLVAAMLLTMAVR